MCVIRHPYLTERQILNCSDEEILNAAKAAGIDPAETSQRVKAILKAAVETAMCDYGGNHLHKDCRCDPYDTGEREKGAK